MNTTTQNAADTVERVCRLTAQWDTSGYTTFRVHELRRGKWNETISGADHSLDNIYRTFTDQLTAGNVADSDSVTVPRALLETICDLGLQDVYTDAYEYEDRVGQLRGAIARAAGFQDIGKCVICGTQCVPDVNITARCPNPTCGE